MKYEIRGYTGRFIQGNNRKLEFRDGIEVPAQEIPLPLKYGKKQSCSIEVPWPNEMFYYFIVGIDQVKIF